MILLFQTILIASSHQLQKFLLIKSQNTQIFPLIYKKFERKLFLITHNKGGCWRHPKYIKTNKTTGPGSFPTRILKDFKKCLSKPIFNLINWSFSLGTFPEILKQAKVIPVFKVSEYPFRQNKNMLKNMTVLL